MATSRLIDSLRGLDVFLAELAAWAEERDPGFETLAYGDDPDQVVDVRRGGDRTAILVHGGFWRPAFTRANTRALAVDLALRGWTTWNVEYRRTGVDDTLADVDAALDLTGPGIAIGHSAGGHLVLWAAGTGKLERAVSLAGVTDLARAAREGIGANAAVEFAGPDPPADADPMRRPAPHGARAARARNGGRPGAVRLQPRLRGGRGVELLTLRGAGHFELIDPRTPEWAQDRRRGSRGPTRPPGGGSRARRTRARARSRPAGRSPGRRSSSSGRTIASSSRASGAPMQKWIPLPNARCAAEPLAFRLEAVGAVRTRTRRGSQSRSAPSRGRRPGSSTPPISTGARGDTEEPLGRGLEPKHLLDRRRREPGIEQVLAELRMPEDERKRAPDRPGHGDVARDHRGRVEAPRRPRSRAGRPTSARATIERAEQVVTRLALALLERGDHVALELHQPAGVLARGRRCCPAAGAGASPSPTRAAGRDPRAAARAARRTRAAAAARPAARSRRRARAARARRRARWRCTRIRGSSSAIRFGVNARVTRPRIRSCSGRVELDDVRHRGPALREHVLDLGPGTAQATTSARRRTRTWRGP